MGKLKILGISASPRNEGNSMFLLKKAIEGAEAFTSEFGLESEIFSFHAKKFSSCNHCYGCERSKGECVIKDNFQELRDYWVSADIVIYSVPVYHVSIPAQLRCFHDRLGMSLSKRYPIRTEGNKVFYAPRYPLKVIGGIAQGMDIFGGQERALQEIIMHAVLLNCIPISGDTRFGAGGCTESSRSKDTLKCLAEKGDALTLATAAEATSIGKRAVQLATILRKGLIGCQTMVEIDEAFRPICERMNWGAGQRGISDGSGGSGGF